MENMINFDPEIRETIIEMGGGDIVDCYQCGRCMPACPWNCLESIEYPVYRYPQAMKVGDIISNEKKEELEKEILDIFRCIGCENCLLECPRGVNMSDVLRAVRRILVEYGSYPPEMKDVVCRVSSSGNPLGEPSEKRDAWAKDLGVPKFSEGCEYLYAPCCVPAYDSRAKRIAQNTAEILEKLGVSFGILGAEESCCGEAIRRVGADEVFQQLARGNIETYRKAGVKKILTTSPHCSLTFKRHYPQFGSEFDVTHISQFLYQMIREQKLVPKKSFKKKVVYHDPCTLGRQLEVYEEPRKVLSSIPELELAEIPVFNRQFSICCGGGSAGVWYDWPQDERLANFRLNQVMNTGADVLAVACPYCLQMFEETLKSVNSEIEVMDITEIIYQCL